MFRTTAKPLNRDRLRAFTVKYDLVHYGAVYSSPTPGLIRVRVEYDNTLSIDVVDATVEPVLNDIVACAPGPVCVVGFLYLQHIHAAPCFDQSLRFRLNMATMGEFETRLHEPRVQAVLRNACRIEWEGIVKPDRFFAVFDMVP